MELFELSNRTMMILGGLFWVAVVLWIWALIDIFRLSRKSTESPAPWLLLIILFPILGSILFFQIGKKRMKDNKRTFDPKFNQR
ncbi:PLDc N-terminal domain-containing protein [Ekhidna sp.]|uniref:PLDc N-terminal domain-containing protein n=1 Tax=Ekhidna sp. TaxID=2608089 RepID=UPI003B512F29